MSSASDSERAPRRSKRPSLRVPVEEEGRRSSKPPPIGVVPERSASAVAAAAVVVVRGSLPPSDPSPSVESDESFDGGDDHTSEHPAFGVDDELGGADDYYASVSVTEASSPPEAFDEPEITVGTAVGDVEAPTSDASASDAPTPAAAAVAPAGPDELDSEAFRAEGALLGGPGSEPPPVAAEAPEPGSEPPPAPPEARTSGTPSPPSDPPPSSEPPAPRAPSVAPPARSQSVPPPPPPVFGEAGASEPARRPPAPPPPAVGTSAPPGTGGPPAPPPPPPTNREAPPREPRMTTPELASGKRGWFEIIFDDDYLRTVRPLSKVGVELQCDFIEEQFGLSPGASILDVGCGSGQHAVELARRGYSVTALDLSSHMLRHAKMNAEEAGVNVTFVHGDMRAMSYDAKFDALLSWNTSFGYFDDDVNRRTMELFHNALKPHGVLLLELANRDFVLQGQPNLIWFEGDGCVCIEETSFNSITSRLLVKRTVIRDDGHQYEHFYSVRLYALHEIGQLMHNRGFRVVRVSGREATPGVFFGADSSRMIVLAERRLPSKSQPRMPRDSGRPTRNDLPPIPTKRSLAPATDTAQTVPEIEADARPDLELDDAGTDPGGEPGPNGDAS